MIALVSADWRLIGRGAGVHWPALDEDISANAIEQYVSRLRKKLDSHGGPEMVKTVRGAGYRVAADGG